MLNIKMTLCNLQWPNVTFNDLWGQASSCEKYELMLSFIQSLDKIRFYTKKDN